MKRSLKRLACTALALLLLFAATPVTGSSVTGIHVVSVYQFRDSNQINLGIRATDSVGMPVANLGPVSITVNEAKVDAVMHPGGASIGHILVVDTSKYYVSTLDMPEILALAEALLDGLPSSHRVMLITTDSSGIQQHGWDSAGKALEKLINKGQQAETEADLYAAIEAGVDIAFAAQGVNAPEFVSSILAVTDCMLGANASRRQASILNKMTQPNRGLAFAMAWPERASYMKGKYSNVEAVSAGQKELANFAENMGGKLIAVQHSGEGRYETLASTQDVTTEVSRQLRGLHYFSLDVSGLIGHVQYKRDDSLTIQLAAGSGIGVAKEVAFSSLQIPTPSPSPTPTPDPATPEPITPEPGPTPVVPLGSDHKEARQVLLRLSELYYLDVDTGGVFNEDARKAFDLFMQINGREWTDGVFQDTFDFLMKGNPIPNPTEIPPEPTPAPADLIVGMRDPEGGPKYIEEMQYVLNVLQCYSHFGNTYTAGLFDEQTLQAVNLFCQHYGVTNNVPTGASLAVQNAIRDAHGKFQPVPPSPSPSPTPDPTPQPLVDLFLGDTDKDFGDTRIEDLQMRLKALNYFDLLGLKPELGVVDEATLAAVEFFCEHNNLANGLDNGIKAALQRNIMEDGWEKIGPSPTPAPTTIIEGVRDKLQSDVSIGDFVIPVWVIALGSAVLLLGIIIVMVLMRAHRKQGKFDEPSLPSRAGDRQRPDGPPADSDLTMPDLSDGSGGMADPGPFDSDMTVPGATGIPVTILIEYAGSSRTETPVIGDSLTIGRKMCNILLNDADKGVSRRHAELFSRNGNLYIRDLGSVNGTFVDGVQVPSSSAQPQGDVTVAMDMFGPGSDDFPVSNGAKVRMGHHTLTLSW